MKKKFKIKYIEPFDFKSLIKFYKAHQIGHLEQFEEEKMVRIFQLEGLTGVAEITNDSKHSNLLVKIDYPDASKFSEIKKTITRVFDTEVDPQDIASALGRDPKIKKILKKHPGIRLPSGWDPFEVAISTILGQLVSMQRARALVSDLIDLLGEDSGMSVDGKKVNFFPTAKALANADLTTLKTTNARKLTLKAFSQALIENKVSLSPDQSIEDFSKDMIAIKGIGKWTADYVALKALKNQDAFPSTDLILARAIVHHPEKVLEKMNPFRGYVAVLLWSEYSTGLNKT